jgi:hypothetical protein
MRPLQAFGVALGVCAIAGTCILYVTKSTAQSVKASSAQAESNASPIYGVTIPAGYRDWRSISVRRLTGAEGKLRQLRARLHFHSLRTYALNTSPRACQSAPKFDPRSACNIGSDSILMKFRIRLELFSRESAPCNKHFAAPALCRLGLL